MTLVDFLAARLAEDEAVAKTAGRSGFPAPDYDPHWRYEDIDMRLSPVGVGPDTFPHIARHDPARVLREVEAMRRILVFAGAIPQPEVTGPVLGWMAGIWDSHPDYEEAWRP